MKTKLTRRFGFAAIIIGLALFGVGLRLLLSPAEFQATTRIGVEFEKEPGVYDPFFIQTQLEVIQSEEVLGKVVETLNLNEKLGEQYAGGKILKTSESVGLIKRRLNVRFINNTKIFDINVTDENPIEAAKIANMIAETFRNLRLGQQQQKLLKMKSESEKTLDAQSAKTSPVEIVDPAVPPKFPIGQNRLLGVVVLICGLVVVVLGFYLLYFCKSATKGRL
jgi:uncharacterized protein involved in exopolysaccharide biosynthesis